MFLFNNIYWDNKYEEKYLINVFFLKFIQKIF